MRARPAHKPRHSVAGNHSTSASSRAGRGRVPAGPALTPSALLRLQQQAGNAAIVTSVQRVKVLDEAGTPLRQVTTPEELLALLPAEVRRAVRSLPPNMLRFLAELPWNLQTELFKLPAGDQLAVVEQLRSLSRALPGSVGIEDGSTMSTAVVPAGRVDSWFAKLAARGLALPGAGIPLALPAPQPAPPRPWDPRAETMEDRLSRAGPSIQELRGLAPGWTAEQVRSVPPERLLVVLDLLTQPQVRALDLKGQLVPLIGSLPDLQVTMLHREQLVAVLPFLLRRLRVLSPEQLGIVVPRLPNDLLAGVAECCDGHTCRP